MAEKQIKPGWKVWRFEQMASNVNVRIDNPSDSGMAHYVGLEHLDPDSLRIRRWVARAMSKRLPLGRVNNLSSRE